jgi:hypothetical protein
MAVKKIEMTAFAEIWSLGGLLLFEYDDNKACVNTTGNDLEEGV